MDSNDHGIFQISGKLYLKKPDGTNMLFSERTYVTGTNGPGVSYNNMDIDRAWFRLSLRPLTPIEAAANGILWSEAAVRAAM